MIGIGVLTLYPGVVRINTRPRYQRPSARACNNLPDRVTGLVRDNGPVVKMVMPAEINPSSCFADGIPEGIPVLGIEGQAVPVSHLKSRLVAENKDVGLLIGGELSIKPRPVDFMLLFPELIEPDDKGILVGEAIG